MKLEANTTYYQELNAEIRARGDADITITNATGQRYIACGSHGQHFRIHGTPGNGLGQYLNGSTVEVFGNAQEAVGDTMNDGTIIIHGNCGDACGYSMRGGSIYVKGNCGYRGGIHMKAYENQLPTLVVGGTCGSFLGEYLAGGLILVLGIGANGAYPVHNFCGNGMHGGKIVLHCEKAPTNLPPQLQALPASEEDLADIRPHIRAYAKHFGANVERLLGQSYYVVTANPHASYRQLYTYN